MRCLRTLSCLFLDRIAKFGSASTVIRRVIQQRYWLRAKISLGARNDRTVMTQRQSAKLSF